MINLIITLLVIAISHLCIGKNEKDRPFRIVGYIILFLILILNLLNSLNII